MAATSCASSNTSCRTRSRAAPTRWSRSAACSRTTTRMVAAVAAKIGMKCRLIQEAWVPHEDAVYDRSATSSCRGSWARRRSSWMTASTSASATAEARAGRGRGRGRQALRDPGRRLGAQVWRARLCRLRRGGAQQEAEMGLRFDYVVVCTVTARPMPACWSASPGRARPQRHRHRRLLHPGPDQGPGPRDRPEHRRPGRRGRHRRRRRRAQRGLRLPVYGVPSQETVEAIRLSARLEGMITDPVYEGKSMQGMIDLVKKGFFPEGLEGALRPSRRRAGAERLQLHVSQRLRPRDRLPTHTLHPIPR